MIIFTSFQLTLAHFVSIVRDTVTVQPVVGSSLGILPEPGEWDSEAWADVVLQWNNLYQVVFSGYGIQCKIV